MFSKGRTNLGSAFSVPGIISPKELMQKAENMLEKVARRISVLEAQYGRSRRNQSSNESELELNGLLENVLRLLVDITRGQEGDSRFIVSMEEESIEISRRISELYNMLNPYFLQRGNPRLNCERVEAALNEVLKNHLAPFDQQSKHFRPGTLLLMPRLRTLIQNIDQKAQDNPKDSIKKMRSELRTIEQSLNQNFERLLAHRLLLQQSSANFSMHLQLFQDQFPHQRNLALYGPLYQLFPPGPNARLIPIDDIDHSRGQTQLPGLR